MPVVGTKAAASAQGFGEFAQASTTATYIEDVFSTWLYTGNGSTQTITNGIDLSGKGGLVWLKQRSLALGHLLMDSARGATNYLSSNTTSAQNSGAPVTFSSTGLSIASGGAFWNQSGDTYVSWTFRKQPKFFDVVTWTGNSVNGRQIAHSLGSVPGCIIVKNTSNSENWVVYHRSNHSGGNDPQNYALYLNTTAGTFGAGFWNNTAPTSTVFTVANDSRVNTSGDTYVAYLFAHNAGGFGLTGTDNVISCGSFTTDGSGLATVNLGYEPQLILYKRTDATGNWNIVDNMRGWAVGGNSQRLQPNTADAEQTSGGGATSPTATGFTVNGGIPASATAIYIAIRRGPMRTPTSGTSVFAVDNTPVNGSTTTPCYDSGFPVDLGIRNRTTGANHFFVDRLRGSNYLLSDSTAAETDGSPNTVVNGYQQGFYGFNSESTSSGVGWMFRRAPGFFDEVCYTGTGSARTVTHNLGVAPELMIVKQRSASNQWNVYAAPLGNNQCLVLNSTAATSATSRWNFTTPTSTVFSVGSAGDVNGSGSTYVAYLFASCPGVSKVGTYTGNGSTQTINCGFTGGARFVLIKRTDSTGDWYVYDTARGMTTLTDPYLLLNSTAAESATLGSVTTVSTGFAVNASILAAINTNAASYIFLAIA